MDDFAIYVPAILALGSCVLVFPFLDNRRIDHRIWVSCIISAMIATYLTWRLFFSLEVTTPIETFWSFLFFAIDVMSSLGSIIVMITLIRIKSRTQEADDHLDWVVATRPEVAIFIATYNEELAILDRTILGALEQTYPGEIYVLDDGRRPWLAEHCAKRGVHYLTRADNRHAKAGNMNAGMASLQQLGKSPEFIAVLDADFVPLPTFVERALALFHDPAVGCVQTPQHFFNSDPLQHSLRSEHELPDEQRFFFDTLLAAKDGWGSAYCCGTSSIIRVAALHAVGGFPTQSVTEDMLLSMRLKSHGFTTSYLNERLSLGLAPEGLAEYRTQRIRWCVGAMQVISGPDGMLGRNGLTLIDRINLLDTLFFWMFGFAFRLLCLLMPVLFWLFGIIAMRAPSEQLAIFLVPLLICQAFATAWYSKGRLLPVMTDASQLLIAPEVMHACAQTLLWPGERPFKVTNKGGDRSKVVVHTKLLLRFVAVIAVTAGAMLFGYFNVMSDAYFSESTAFVTFWSIYNILVCLVGVMVTIEQPRHANQRFAVEDETVALIDDSGIRVAQLVDISATGVGFSSDHPFAIGTALSIKIARLPILPIQVVRCEGKAHGARLVIDEADYAEIIRLVFSGYFKHTDRLAPKRSLIALLRGMFR